MRALQLYLCAVTVAFFSVCHNVHGSEEWGSGRQLVALRGRKKVQVYNNPTAAAFSSDWTPIRVKLGKDFNSSTVTLCKLDWKKRAEVCCFSRKFLWQGLSSRCQMPHFDCLQTPATLPMFQDLIRVSKCNRVANRKMVTLAGMADVIEPWLKAEAAGKWNAEDPEFGQHAKNFPQLQPSGLIFHEMRVGSTLLSNMLQAASGNLAYSESPPPMDIMRHSTAERSVKVRALRVVIAAMSRVSGFDRFYFKFQMVPFPEMYHMLWEAFPNTPWVYLFRRPEDVMVSMFRMQADRKLPTDIDAPCTRSQRRRPEPHVVTLLTEQHADVKRASRKEFCAAYLATLNWASIEAMAQATKQKLATPAGWFLHYNSLKPMARTVITQLFKTELNDEQWHNVNATASVYSKSRGKKAEAATKEFGTDNKRKSEVLTDEVIWFTSKYLYSQYGELLELARALPGLPQEQKTYLGQEGEWLTGGGSKSKMQDTTKWEALEKARLTGGQVQAAAASTASQGKPVGGKPRDSWTKPPPEKQKEKEAVEGAAADGSTAEGAAAGGADNGQDAKSAKQAKRSAATKE